MRFGLFYEHQLPRPWEPGAEQRLYNDALEQIEIADRAGFDFIWEVEHHFMEEYSHSSAPEVFLAAASQRTQRIRLGHGIVQLPQAVNHPARIAERIATLDLVSNGRVEFGTGESSSAAELGGFGVRRDRKREMWEDAIEAITHMFVEEPFAGWESRYLQMPPRNVVPKPVQKPHPPLWVACSRRETIHFAAQKGIGALSFSFAEPEEAAQWVEDYYRILASDECVPAGFAVNPNLAVVLPMMVHEDEQTAIERGIDGAHFFGYALAHYYGITPHVPGRTSVWDEFTQRREHDGFSRDLILADDAPLAVKVMRQGLGSMRGAVGTPAQVAELCRRYEAVGVDQIGFCLQAGMNKHEDICEAIELFGKQVIPEFAEDRERREREKEERLAPFVSAALARRSPPREFSGTYRIDEQAEVERARRVRRPSRANIGSLVSGTRADLRSAARRRGQHALGRFVRDRSDDAIERRLGSSVAQGALFRAMARSFEPSMAFGFEGEIEFDLTTAATNGDARLWTIEVKDGKASARSGAAREPRVRLHIGVADFMRLMAGEANGAVLLLEGKIQLDGDLGLAPRLTEMFGGPSPY
jgi:alkanesulfonate monooxygenase SsuD/methylene tetrahydromethanopterin reductase-like flavin-dependent oxidoreductase (luciferase family)